MIGGVEAGGTKFNCAIARNAGEVVARARIPTTTPEETLTLVGDFFARASAQHGPLRALGIASFGPIELRAASPDRGRLLRTPKPGWSGVDLLAPLRGRLGCPIAIDVDVGAAALAEHRLGAGLGADALAYVTVGTGIGAGLIVDGRPLRGLMHPEAGHVPVRRLPGDGSFAGVCPFHHDCLEGLASGPAIEARWKRPLSALGEAEAGLIAGYLGQLCANLALTVSLERIIMGGGVLETRGLLAAIRAETRTLLNRYLPHPMFDGPLDDFIVAPGLGDDSGLTGALLLASDLLRHGA